MRNNFRAAIAQETHYNLDEFCIILTIAIAVSQCSVAAKLKWNKTQFFSSRATTFTDTHVKFRLVLHHLTYWTHRSCNFHRFCSIELLHRAMWMTNESVDIKEWFFKNQRWTWFSNSVHAKRVPLYFTAAFWGIASFHIYSVAVIPFRVHTSWWKIGSLSVVKTDLMVKVLASLPFRTFLMIWTEIVWHCEMFSIHFMINYLIECVVTLTISNEDIFIHLICACECVYARRMQYSHRIADHKVIRRRCKLSIKQNGECM